MDKELFLAASDSSWERVQNLLQEGANPVKFCDSGGWTALHEISQNGDLSSLLPTNIIIDNINITAMDGWTPLLIAVANNRPDNVKVLLSKGADATIKCRINLSPLKIAVMHSHFDVITVMLRFVPGLCVFEDLEHPYLLDLTDDGHIASLLIPGGARCWSRGSNIAKDKELDSLISKLT